MTGQGKKAGPDCSGLYLQQVRFAVRAHPDVSLIIVAGFLPERVMLRPIVRLNCPEYELLSIPNRSIVQRRTARDTVPGPA